MTFRELAFQEELKLSSPHLNQEQDIGLVKAFIDNQSPIMKLWFVIMLINLGLFLVITQ